jgi:peptidoglycan DL-endopeptidase CwlO
LSFVLGTVAAVAFTLVVAVHPAGSVDSTVPTHAPASLRHGVATQRGAALAMPSAMPTGEPRPAKVGDAPPVPPAVALDPTLAKPLPGDTAETRAARRKLAEIDDAYQLANQLYDKARPDALEAAAQVVRAQAAAALATARAHSAHADFATVVTAQYEGGDDAAMAGRLLVADDAQDVLNQLEIQRILADRTAAIFDLARRTDAAAAAARQRVEQAEAAARAAEARADAQLVAASNAVKSAQETVAKLHSADLAAAIAASADALAGAATAIQGQAIDSGAATVRDFAVATGPAQAISVGTRALLEQAAGHRKRPKHAPAGTPAYHATKGTPVDEQAVMGPTPDLGGSIPYAGETGTGPVLALTRFDGTVNQSGWPNAGVGTKVRGTAPFLKPDGRTVHPAMPAYRKGHPPLRAEVAVDAALSQLGSPYVWDAAGTDTFDCSGLTLWAWGHAGVPLEHYTGIQVHQGQRVEPNELLPGDLLLFGAKLHHVGMYLGGGYMIDAPTTGDYVKIQPVSDDGDFTVAVRP